MPISRIPASSSGCGSRNLLKIFSILKLHSLHSQAAGWCTTREGHGPTDSTTTQNTRPKETTETQYCGKRRPLSQRSLFGDFHSTLITREYTRGPAEKTRAFQRRRKCAPSAFHLLRPDSTNQVEISKTQTSEWTESPSRDGVTPKLSQKSGGVKGEKHHCACASFSARAQWPLSSWFCRFSVCF